MQGNILAINSSGFKGLNVFCQKNGSPNIQRQCDVKHSNTVVWIYWNPN